MKQLVAVAMVAVMTGAAACANQKMPAEMALKGLESTFATAQPDIAAYAAGELAGLSGAVAGVRREFDAGNYPAVLNAVPEVSTKVTEVAAAAATRKANLAAEWTTMAGLPAMLAQVKTRYAELDARSRKRFTVDRTGFQVLAASIAEATTSWNDATDAFGRGDLATAVAKGHEAQPRIATLMDQLGLAAPAAR